MKLLTLLTAAAARISSSMAQFACTSDMDCALNGDCQASGDCICNPGWTSADCSQLLLLPAAQSAHGLHLLETSSWGGSVMPLSASALSGTVHMFASVFKHCGLTSWLHNSYIAHTVSMSGLVGPFAIADVAIDVWSHNVVVVNVSTAAGPGYLMFHIGDGTNGDGYLQPCAPGANGSNVANGTSQCGLLWFSCDPPPLCDDFPPVDGYECVSYACSGDEPWTGSDGGALTAHVSDVGATPLRDDVDCGDRLADVHLNCSSAAECLYEAAGACAVTAGCASYAISAFLQNYTWAMLFSSGREGTRPNAQWNTWVRLNATAYAATSGRSARLAQHGRRVPLVLPRRTAGGGSSFPVSFSASLYGPWTTVYANTTAPTNANNPAPFVAANGSVFVVFNDGNMSMFRSDAGWRGPYELVTTGACGGGEDPFIWQDARGQWHCLFHRAPFADPAAQAIGHAFSPDGFAWFTSPVAAANSTVQFEGNGTGDPLSVTFGKRERPHLVFTDDGSFTPLALITGVGINPACDPFDWTLSTPPVPVVNATRLAAINAGVVPNCDAWVQYQRLDLNPQPAYFDRSWTLVQLIGAQAARPAVTRA